MRAIVRLGSDAVLKNVELPSGVKIHVDEGAKNVTIDNVSSSGLNTDRPEMYIGEGAKNVKVDGKKVC